MNQPETPPQSSRDLGRILLIVLAIWAGCFAMSFLHAWLAEPEGDGFSRGMAVLGIFVLWQLGAMLMAVVALVVRLVGYDRITGVLRWLGFLPMAATLVMIALIAASVMFDG